jgi:hypothetical protein
MVLPRNLPERTEKNHENLSQVIRFPDINLSSGHLNKAILTTWQLAAAFGRKLEMNEGKSCDWTTHLGRKKTEQVYI